jgi:cation:H+ antiporter
VPLAFDALLGTLDGAILLAVLFAYVAYLVYLGRKNPEASLEDVPAPRAAAGWLLNVALVVVGLVLLVWGSRWLVAGALTIAKAMGVSELIIGLTIVAAGTSLPEVATSVIAAARGQRDIAVGNVVGSCIFNVLAVLGLSSIVAPKGIAIPPAVLGFDIPIMIAVSVVAWPILWTSKMISRGEGLLFLFYYAAYTFYLILHAAEHDALPVFNFLLLVVIIPISMTVALLVAVRTRSDRELRDLHRRSGREPAP